MLFVGIAGAVASLTVLFRGMRALMATGASSCASGGPYVVANPCPKGVAAMVPLSIWIGIGFVALASVAAMKVGAPSIAWLAWPALFLSLGWNFWEFGLDPPGAEGVAVGWIVCGVLFVLMGAGPVVLAVANPQDLPGASRAAAVGTTVRAATTPPPFRRPPPMAQDADDDADAEGLVGALERLAQLHRSGALDDDEYRAAKATLLGGPR